MYYQFYKCIVKNISLIIIQVILIKNKIKKYTLKTEIIIYLKIIFVYK